MAAAYDPLVKAEGPKLQQTLVIEPRNQFDEINSSCQREVSHSDARFTSLFRFIFHPTWSTRICCISICWLAVFLRGWGTIAFVDGAFGCRYSTNY